jgi:hypothetical protein
MEMNWDDLIEWHNVTAYQEDTRAEQEMERWQSMDAKSRGSAPYVRI